MLAKTTGTHIELAVLHLEAWVSNAYLKVTQYSKEVKSLEDPTKWLTKLDIFSRRNR